MSSLTPHISIEGNIASGKSTLIAALSQNPRYDCYPEPLDKWEKFQCNGTYENLLQLYYNQPQTMFAFQSYARLTFVDIAERAPRLGTKAKVTERCLFSSTAFTDAHRHMSKPEQAINDRWTDYFKKSPYIPTAMIYLKTDPEICFERVQRRGREAEKSLSLEDLRQLHASMDDFVNYWEKWARDPLPIHVLGQDQDMSSIIAQAAQIIDDLIIDWTGY